MITPLQTSDTPLPKSARLGEVHLKVSNLGKSIAFYEDVLGLQVLNKNKTRAEMGTATHPLLHLREINDAVRPNQNTGLYHFALLVPHRLELARFLQNLVNRQTPVQGAVDHVVSEAIYLGDPDGNGIEVYVDKPVTEWETRADGSLVMDNRPFDFDNMMKVLEDEAGWEGIASETVLGHMHLHVNELQKNLSFYQNSIGLDLMALWGGSAGFMASNHYHHHLGLNTWQGVGALPPAENAVGLEFFSISVPLDDERDALLAQVEQHGGNLKAIDEGVLLKDPSGNGILICK